MGRAGADDAPDHAHAGARVEAAGQDRGQLGDDLAERVGEVLGQVRARGVAARAAQRDVEVVGGAGDRALAEADAADVEGRVAVQPEDPVDVVEGARARSARARRRASPPRPAGRAAGPGRGSSPCSWTRPSATAAPTRAAVCTSWPQAWVTPSTVLAQGSPVRSGTGSASRSARSATTGPPAPISATRPVRGSSVTRQPACAIRGGDQRGRADLAPRQLGVRVQVAAQRDQLGVDTRRRRRRSRLGGASGLGRWTSATRLPEHRCAAPAVHPGPATWASVSSTCGSVTSLPPGGVFGLSSDGPTRTSTVA